MNYINEHGRLSVTKKIVNLDTVMDSQELEMNRLTDDSLKDLKFIVGNMFLYTLDSHDDLVLNVSSKDNNLIFKNINDAIIQLASNKYYGLNHDDTERVVYDASTRSFPMGALGSKNVDYYSSTIEFDIRNHKRLNHYSRLLFECLHGKGENLRKFVKMSVDEQLFTDDATYITKMNMPNQNYLKSLLNKNGNKGVAFLGTLDTFNNLSRMNLGFSNMFDDTYAIRGLPKCVPVN